MSDARTPLERMQDSRARTDYAYSRARNAAERAVVHLLQDKHPAIYVAIQKAVDNEIAGAHRAVRQSRVRSSCAAYFREEFCEEWLVLLDAHIAIEAEIAGVTIKRRKGC